MPDAIPATVAAAFIFISFFTSALTAAFGVGGGLVLLVVMGFFMPAGALIPVHGVIQLGSNAGRAWHMRRHATPLVMAPFIAGGILGAVIGGSFAIDLPDFTVKLFMAAFVIVLTWVRLPRFVDTASPLVFGVGGLVTTALSIIIGASGPIVAAIIGKAFAVRQTMVANFAIAMTSQHLLKVLAFGFLGFSLAPWLPLAAAMIASGYLGTRTGARLLDRTGEDRFRFWLKIGITILAVEMVRRAWGAGI